MTFFLCKLWPYLAGGLIGWLLAGWFARRLKYTDAPTERVVEKHIDNPQHLSLISRLEDENKKIPDLVSKIATFESATSKTKTVEKIVEKVIDNPDHLARIKKLETENAEISSLRKRIKSFENQTNNVAETTIDNPDHVKRISELEGQVADLQRGPAIDLEKVIDNPDHLARIKKLETENAEISSLRKRIKSFENQTNNVAETTIDNPDHVKRISELEGQVADLQRGPAIDLKAAKAAGLAIKTDTDFTVVEGIGPKINDLIHADGITSFRQLADAEPARIQKLLDAAGSSYSSANPSTWPDQANLVVNNRWSALKALQDVLDRGVYPDGSAKAKDAASTSNSSGTTAAKKKAVKKAPLKLDVDAAKAAGFKVKQNNGQDDFTVIEGIGPKINELIHNAGIHTFTDLANKHVDVIQKILDKAGPRYRLAKPGTWPAQSDMAANNKWDSLKAWQDELDGGV